MQLHLSLHLSFLRSLLHKEPAGPVVPEEPAGPVVPASALPGGTPRFVSGKEHQTPAIMQRLAPPFCTFALDFKAHRFSFKYRKAPSPNVWTEHFKHPMSMSKTFANMPFFCSMLLG